MPGAKGLVAGRSLDLHDVPGGSARGGPEHGRRVSLDPRGACGIPFFLEPFLPDPPGFGVSGDPQWFWGLRGSPVGHGADWIPVVKTDQKHTCSEILLGITWSRVRE